MVVMAIQKWNVHRDKVEAYLKWTEGGVNRFMSVPGIVEFRAYRMIAGGHQVAATYEFVTWALMRPGMGIKRCRKSLMKPTHLPLT